MRRAVSKTTIRVYERQDDFVHGMATMQRKGWRLTSFHQPSRNDALDLIRASGPGLIPQGARAQIVAHYVCATGSSRPSPAVRSRVARLLMQIATRLDQPHPTASDDTVCTSPA